VRLDWLRLSDFRCYEALEMAADPGVNLLVGDNGTGKSSVLEAIGYLATLRSFRRSPDSSLVREGCAAAVVRGEFTSGDSTVRIEIEVPVSGRRRVLLNGKPAGRAAVSGLVVLVAFLPDDLDLVKRGPAYRREYLDDLTAQMWPAAGAEQSEYERALRQRNALLRREGRYADGATLDVWDERVAALGGVVVRRRLDALERLGPLVSRLYADLGEGAEEVSWDYLGAGVGEVSPDAGAADLVVALGEALAEARPGDLERRMTTVGPHRDELSLGLGGRDVRTRASQGEQRTLALGLRIAAYDLLREQRNAAPVLVLDDVFSEMDASRTARLVERLPGGQVFVSTAREEDVPVHGARWVVGGGALARGGVA